VGPVEGGQHARHGRLHAEGDPVVAGFPQPLEVGAVDGVGVGLGGDLGVRRQAEIGVDRGEQPAEVLGREERRRTPAEEDGADRDVDLTEDGASQPDLGDRVVDVRLPGDAAAQLLGRVGVEVAVPAPHPAERDVDVEPERSGAEARQRGRREAAVRRRDISLGQRGRHSSDQP
jgi:hypothetical protein